jgi:hypothetical protein
MFEGNISSSLEMGANVVIAPDVYQNKGDFTCAERPVKGIVMNVALTDADLPRSVVISDVEVNFFYGTPSLQV